MVATEYLVQTYVKGTNVAPSLRVGTNRRFSYLKGIYCLSCSDVLTAVGER
jgi:hypothetical protein